MDSDAAARVEGPAATRVDSPPAPAGRARRVALGRSRRRLSFERRIRTGLWLLLLPSLLLGAALLHSYGSSPALAAVLLSLLLLGWAAAVTLLLDAIVRPLQTLANVLAALREEDYSLRARGGRRNDAVGDLALEANALAAMLQARRGGDMEATALLERVMGAMPSPLLAFAPDGTLRLHNDAATKAFQLPRTPVGRNAAMLRLDHVYTASHDDLLSIVRPSADGGGQARWIVQRSTFRLRGIPHVLIVLSDVSSALRDEERAAWKRLIRVISHEVNNSLTPIKSIAGSLRAHLPGQPLKPGSAPDSAPNSAPNSANDLERGLAVIETRAESLNRFLQGYSQLAALPSPQRTRIALEPLLERVCSLEHRLQVQLVTGPATARILGDPDQLQQALINLVKNAADAALSIRETHDARNANPHGNAHVSLAWRVAAPDLVLLIRDNGPGLANQSNLFVPFYTTKPNGTGIGLVLALQIVEAHGGTLRLRNRDQADGCEAEIRLPLEVTAGVDGR